MCPIPSSRKKPGGAKGADTTKTNSSALSPGPSSTTEGVQKASGVSSGPKLQPTDSSGEVKGNETTQDYVTRMLADAAAYFGSPKFTAITSAMQNMVNASATFRDNIKDALKAHNMTPDAFTGELQNIFTGVVNNLKNNLPPPGNAPGHPGRAELVDKVLGDASLALTNLVARYGIDEEAVKTYFLAMKPHVQALVVAVGDINEQYPRLFSILTFSVSVLLIPESWILKPFLSMLGFGPLGPIKGSAAAWMQSYFWGAAVKAGSWFSFLQAAGMGVYPAWAGYAAKGVYGGLRAFLFSFRRK